MISLGVLVVEDEPGKLERLLSVVLSVTEMDEARTQVANDLFSARQALVDNQFDVLILDIALPPYPGGAATLRPDFVFSVSFRLGPRSSDCPRISSALPATRTFSRQRQVPSPVGCLRWSFSTPVAAIGSTRWRRGCAHCVVERPGLSSQPRGYQSYLGVLCALHSPELTAALNLPWEWLPEPDPSSCLILARFSAPGR